MITGVDKGLFMTQMLITELRNQDSKDIDLMESMDIVRIINQEDLKVAQAVQKVLPQVAKAVDCIAEAFAKGGRLAYFGAGTSGRLGILDASECPPTFGTEPEMVQAFIAGGNAAIKQAVENAEDNAEMADRDIDDFAPDVNDVVVAISASGNPEYVLRVLQKAKDAGAMTVAVSSNPEAKMQKYADVFINPIVGPEVVTGSSRMKSGTAQKMVLNMLTTAAMIRIGKTYENFMIDVRVLNHKLYDRACRIVAEITGVDYETAEKYLNASGLKVKTACVMILGDCSKEKAEQILAAENGVLRKVMGKL